MRNSLQQLTPLYALAAQDPYFLDDGIRDGDPLQLLLYVLQRGEFFLCLTADKKRVIGFAILRDIVHCRSAHLEAWAHPDFRGPHGKPLMDAHFKEIIEYAFEPWPKGLGLQKIKAEVSDANTPCLITCHRLGFEAVGRSQLDQFHNGVAYDSVLLELLNPAVFKPVAESINGFEQQDPDPADLYAATSGADLRTADEPGEDSTPGDVSGTDYEGGASERSIIARISSASQRPA